MAKRSEATAQFEELEAFMDDWKDILNNEGILTSLKEFLRSIVHDINGEDDYYKYKKTKSETVKFLKSMKSSLDNIKQLYDCLNKQDEYKKNYTSSLKALKEKYPTLKYKKDGKAKTSRELNSDERNSIGKLDDYIRTHKEYMEDWGKEYTNAIKKAEVVVIKKFGIDFLKIENEVKRFIKVLEKQSKPGRRIFGHISRFANEKAIETLKKVLVFLKEYQETLYKALVKELSESLSKSEN